MTSLVLLLLTLGVLAVIAALLTGHLSGGGLEPEASTVPVRALPPGPVTGADVHDLRFPTALRGYRQETVDAALDRLAAEIDDLRSQLAGTQDGV